MLRSLILYACLTPLVLGLTKGAFAQPGSDNSASKAVAINTPAPKPSPAEKQITSVEFAGLWKGSENCVAMSTPDALLNITCNGKFQVLITGLYATTGDVKGFLSGNTIEIPLQSVPDDAKMKLEGRIVLSPDHKSLSSTIGIMNDGIKDVCTNTYQK